MSSKRSSSSKESPHKGPATVAKAKPKPSPRSVLVGPFKNAKPSKSKLNIDTPLHDANVLVENEAHGVGFIVSHWSGETFVGARVAKPFGGKTKKWFYGSVDRFQMDPKTNQKVWHVTYEDGDQEEMNEDDFCHWLKQYNILWDAEMKSSEIPYQKNNLDVQESNENQPTPKRGRPAKSTPKSNTKKDKPEAFKVSWRFSRKLEEWGDGAFDDCFGSEVQECAEIYREEEMDTGRLQKKELYTTVEEANAVAADQFKMLQHRYMDDNDDDDDDNNHDNDNEDRDKSTKITTTDGNCKCWRWSYTVEDEHENIFRCAGFVQVERISK